jgi:tRNA A37 threonylcarbamoyladenosine biosynthesis protein TsaE
MSKQNDLVLGGDDENVDELDLLEVIENQILVVNECREWVEEIYDEMPADKIRVVSTAMKVIYKAQRKLLSEI